MLALSQTAGIVMAGIGLAIVVVIVALVVARVRHAEDKGPDIPPAMSPGPSDPNLEKPILERLQGWGVILVAFMAVWIAAYWFFEPGTNKKQEEHRVESATEHGAHIVELFDEHSNPAGAGCVQCHGPELRGQEFVRGGDIFRSANLTTVCERLTMEEMFQTIAEGRESAGMPSWSVEYKGAMNDQQIMDVVQYLVTVNEETVPFEKNKCINEEAASPAPAPSPEASPTEAP
ncbi:MAG: c-type cytochrome [Actinomycetota bacterium]